MENKELEAAIFADPDNPDVWAVYGDWLQSQSDPRGELIALELALRDLSEEERDADPRMETVKKIYEQNKAKWGPGVASQLEENDDVHWKYGYVSRIILPDAYEEGEKESIEAFLQPNSVKFLRNLNFSLYDVPDVVKSVLEHLQKCSPLRVLNQLMINCGQFQTEEHDPIDIDVLLDINPDLSTLILSCDYITSDRSPRTHTGLKNLELKLEIFGDRTFPYLSKSKFPNLEVLTITRSTGHEDETNPPLMEAIAELFQIQTSPQLKQFTLGLSYTHQINKMPALMANTPLLNQLQELSIYGPLDDQAGEELLMLSQSYAHLQEMSLKFHDFSNSMKTKLHKQFKEMSVALTIASGQKDQGAPF